MCAHIYIYRERDLCIYMFIYTDTAPQNSEQRLTRNHSPLAEHRKDSFTYLSHRIYLLDLEARPAQLQQITKKTTVGRPSNTLLSNMSGVYRTYY